MSDISPGEDRMCSEADVSPLCEENRIKVVCRVRPPVARETHGVGTANRCVSVSDDRRTVVLNSKPQGKSFTFDYAAGEGSTQEELFAEVGRPVTEACLEGYNGTIFCYGQTGSGKTFTTFGPGAAMEGHVTPNDLKSYELRGLVPRVLEYLYNSIDRQVKLGNGKVTYSCRCSFYEIFNEKVFDLVDDGNRDAPQGLTVREDTRKGVYVEGLMEEKVDGAEAASEVLSRGFRNRHVGETAMNRESSRSHAVFTLVIKADEVVEEEGLTRSRVARFNLVDLAGSERQKDTQASGERLKEASNINKSLSTLGQVINALVEKSAGRFRHIHYRDSKLTFLLRDSLGGNSKTVLVAAVSPADQNFGETLSTLKFAQRAKMIKNLAVKNEDTNGSFDALRREVASLRQKLAAAHQKGPADPMRDALIMNDATAAVVRDAGDVTAFDALLANALRRARSAEEAQKGTRRRVETLLSAVEKTEKDVLQLKMVIKFRDGTIAAQRKRDADQERIILSEENAHLRKKLEGGAHESAEVSKWRLQCREAEARLAEVMGTKPGDSKTLVWGIGDEERFRGELDETVLRLTEEKRQLIEEAEAFEERMVEATKRAEKRRLSAANRAELEAKKLVEDALLSKLQKTQAQVERRKATIAASAERIAKLEEENAQLDMTATTLMKQLEDAKRRGREAIEDRDVRLSGLQSKMEELSREKARAVEDSGTEVASLELKLATAIKDNGGLLRRNRALEAEADSLDHELERLDEEKNRAEGAARAAQAAMTEAIGKLERRMQQQEEAHERESEEFQAEKRSLMRDVEAVNRRLKTAEDVHRRDMEEQEGRSNDLQERLVETRTSKEEVECRLKQLQDDYDTLSEQAEYSAGRAMELEVGLEQAKEDLRRAHAAGVARACVAQASLRRSLVELDEVRDELVGVEQRLEAETFLRLVQEGLLAQEKEDRARLDKELAILTEELEYSRAFAGGMEDLLVAEGKLTREIENQRLEQAKDVERILAMMRQSRAETSEAVADAGVLRGVLGHQTSEATDARRELEEACEEREALVEEYDKVVERASCREVELGDKIHELEHAIAEKQRTEDATKSTLAHARADLETHREKLADSLLQYEAQTRSLEELEVVTSSTRRELSSARERVVELEASVTEAEARAMGAKARGDGLQDELERALRSCSDLESRAVTGEKEIERLSGVVEALENESDRRQVEAAAAVERAEAAAKEKVDAAIARETAMAEEGKLALAQRDAEKTHLEAQITTLATELEVSRESASTLAETVSSRQQELVKAAVTLSMKEESLASAEGELSKTRKELSKSGEELATLEAERSTLSAAKVSLEESVTAARAECEKNKAELVARQHDLAELRKLLSSKEEEVRSIDRELCEGRRVMEELQEKLVGARETEAALVKAKMVLEEANDVAKSKYEAMSAALASKEEEVRSIDRELCEGRRAMEELQEKLVGARETEAALVKAKMVLEEANDVAKSKYEAMSAALASSESAAAEREKVLASKDGDLAKANLVLVEKERELTSCGGELRRVTEVKDALEEELARSKESEVTLMSTKSRLEEGIASVRLERDQAIAKSAATDSIAVELRKDLEAMGTQLEGARAEITNQEKEMTLNECKLSEIQIALGALEGQLAVARESGVAMESINRELEKANVSMDSELIEARSKLKSSENDLSVLKERMTAKEEVLVHTAKELRAAVAEAETNESVFRQELEKAEAEAAAAKMTVTMERNKLANEQAMFEERLSAEAARTKVADGRVVELESSRARASERAGKLEREVDSLTAQVAELQQEARLAAGNVEEAEALMRELANRVLELKAEVEGLQGKLMSSDERQGMEAEMEDQRVKMDEMRHRVDTATARCRELEEQMEATKEEQEGFSAKVQELQDLNVKLSSHKNNRQKIHQMQKLKEENNALSRKIKELDDRLFQIKRSGCGSGCGLVAAGGGDAVSSDANKSSAGSDGDGSGTSSSSSRCQPSPTRATRANESEDAGNNRTYNLRRRGKTIDEGVRTRRGGGLRDVTNAS